MSLGYDMLLGAGLVVSSPVWGYRLLRSGKWRTDWPGRLGRCPIGREAGPGADPRPTLLIHAVSVGEVNTIKLLIETLRRHTRDRWRIMVSVTTDTGVARAKELFEPEHRVVRYPLDMGFCVRRFLDAVRPNLVALVELEVWPNFVGECVRRGAPVCVINGRLSQRSFTRYRKVRSLLRPTFAGLSVAAVQTEAYAGRFVAMGTPAERVHVLDSMKWDTAPLDAQPGAAKAIHGGGKGVPGGAMARAMGIDPGRPVIVAGSTGPGEERMLIDTCPTGAQLVLVPRRPERFEEVAALRTGMTRRSRHPDGSDPPIEPNGVFLIDTMGELIKAYTLADVAVVGRSFLGLFGSNVLEPVGLGKPTIIGPHHSDFADIVGVLRQAGGIEVTDRPGEAAARLLADHQRAQTMATIGREVILQRRGATQRHVALLSGLMPEHRTADN